MSKLKNTCTLHLLLPSDDVSFHTSGEWLNQLPDWLWPADPAVCRGLCQEGSCCSPYRIASGWSPAARTLLERRPRTPSSTSWLIERTCVGWWELKKPYNVFSWRTDTAFYFPYISKVIAAEKVKRLVGCFQSFWMLGHISFFGV